MNAYKKIIGMCSERGLVVTGLARTIGISPSCIWRLRDPNNSITLPTAQKIANYFQIPVEDLLFDRDVSQKRDALFEKRKVLFDLSSKCSEEDLERFITMMNAIVKESEAGGIY